jgi:hypothetical protein
MPFISPTEQQIQSELRVCIVAENASFRFGGEASLPLQYFSRLRHRGIESWLIIHGRARSELEGLLPHEQDCIQYIPDEWYHKLIWKLSRVLPRRVSEASFGILMVRINQFIQRHGEAVDSRAPRQCRASAHPGFAEGAVVDLQHRRTRHHWADERRYGLSGCFQWSGVPLYPHRRRSRPQQRRRCQ